MVARLRTTSQIIACRQDVPLWWQWCTATHSLWLTLATHALCCAEVTMPSPSARTISPPRPGSARASWLLAASCPTLAESSGAHSRGPLPLPSLITPLICCSHLISHIPLSHPCRLSMHWCCTNCMKLRSWQTAGICFIRMLGSMLRCCVLCRVNGNLNLSRAIGDLKYKGNDTLPPKDQIITAQPDIMQVCARDALYGN